MELKGSQPHDLDGRLSTLEFEFALRDNLPFISQHHQEKKTSPPIDTQLRKNYDSHGPRRTICWPTASRFPQKRPIEEGKSHSEQSHPFAPYSTSSREARHRRNRVDCTTQAKRSTIRSLEGNRRS
jgi:hypothetical protein